MILDESVSFVKFMKEKCKKINMRIDQLGKMRKYIDNWTANNIYKQTIIPLFDYADFLIEKTVRIIDCNTHKQTNMIDLEV